MVKIEVWLDAKYKKFVSLKMKQNLWKARRARVPEKRGQI